MLCGLSFPSSGSGYGSRFDINAEPEQIKRHIGYMSQKFSLYETMTVDENLRLFASICGFRPRKHSAAWISFTVSSGWSLCGIRSSSLFPNGWKQKLAFSAATIHNPAVVFWMNPPEAWTMTRRKFWELIYRSASEGTTLFVTTHYLDEAEYCNRVSIMVDGRIDALDSPAALKARYGAYTMDEVFRKVAVARILKK